MGFKPIPRSDVENPTPYALSCPIPLLSTEPLFNEALAYMTPPCKIYFLAKISPAPYLADKGLLALILMLEVTLIQPFLLVSHIKSLLDLSAKVSLPLPFLKMLALAFNWPVT